MTLPPEEGPFDPGLETWLKFARWEEVFGAGSSM